MIEKCPYCEKDFDDFTGIGWGGKNTTNRYHCNTCDKSYFENLSNPGNIELELISSRRYSDKDLAIKFNFPVKRIIEEILPMLKEGKHEDYNEYQTPIPPHSAGYYINQTGYYKISKIIAVLKGEK